MYPDHLRLWFLGGISIIFPPSENYEVLFNATNILKVLGISNTSGRCVAYQVGYLGGGYMQMPKMQDHIASMQ